ncbi:MAG: methylmalonyl-CoA mutase family protein, partial [Fidelibacterota bacterium]
AVDPLGGSYYIEEATNRIETEAIDLIDRVDQMGGAVSAIEKGFVQNEIAESAYEFQKAVDSGERVIVGVNKFTDDESLSSQSHHWETQSIDKDAVAKQIDRVKRFKKNRDHLAVQSARNSLQSAAKTGGNLMPEIIQAARTQVTLGEISDTLREVFGEYEGR